LIQRPTVFVALSLGLLFGRTSLLVLFIAGGLPQQTFASSEPCAFLAVDSAGIARHAARFATLVSVYTPRNADSQFEKAISMAEPAQQQKFRSQLLHRELPHIDSTQRSQQFKIDREKISVRMSPDNQRAEVIVPGHRVRSIRGKALPQEPMHYTVELVPTCRGSRREVLVNNLQLSRGLGTGRQQDLSPLVSDQSPSPQKKQSQELVESQSMFKDLLVAQQRMIETQAKRLSTLESEVMKLRQEVDTLKSR